MHVQASRPKSAAPFFFEITVLNSRPPASRCAGLVGYFSRIEFDLGGFLNRARQFGLGCIFLALISSASTRPAYAGCPGLAAPAAIGTALTDVLYDPVAGVMKACVGGSWVSLGTGGGGGASALAALSDVSVTGIGNGKSLVYNSTSSKWEPQTIGGGSSALATLTDVDTTGVADGKSLVYSTSAGKWIALPVTGGASALSDLSDVSTSGLSNGKALVYNSTSSKWEPQTISSGSGTVAGTTGKIAKFTGANAVGDSVIAEDSGNVGIGTASPAQKLDVAGIVNSQYEYRLGGLSYSRAGIADTGGGWFGGYNVKGNAQPAASMRRDSTGTDAAIWFNSNGVQFFTDTSGSANTTPTERMRIDTSGNVGIGTTGPATKLDVRGGGLLTNLSFQDSGGTVYPDNWIGMASNVDGASNKWLHIGGITDNTDGTGAKRRIGIFADRIFLGGNVGIGTATPASKLQVNEGQIRVSASGYPRIEHVLGGTFLWSVGPRTDNDYYIYREGGSGNVLIPNGNVGIGTASPNAKLDVQGSSGSTLKVVDGNQASGKVLTSDANGIAGWQYQGGLANVVGTLGGGSAAAATTNVANQPFPGTGTLNLPSAGTYFISEQVYYTYGGGCGDVFSGWSGSNIVAISMQGKWQACGASGTSFWGTYTFVVVVSAATSLTPVYTWTNSGTSGQVSFGGGHYIKIGN